MCAIFGFVNYRRSLSRSEMKELINRLSVESEVRGKDATGIAYVKHDELKVFKRAKTCSQGKALCARGHSYPHRSYENDYPRRR